MLSTVQLFKITPIDSALFEHANRGGSCNTLCKHRDNMPLNTTQHHAHSTSHACLPMLPSTHARNGCCICFTGHLTIHCKQAHLYQVDSRKQWWSQLSTTALVLCATGPHGVHDATNTSGCKPGRLPSHTPYWGKQSRQNEAPLQDPKALTHTQLLRFMVHRASGATIRPPSSTPFQQHHIVHALTQPCLHPAP